MDKIVIKEIKIKPKRLCQELTCEKPAETILRMKYYGKLYLCKDCLRLLLKEVIIDGIKRRYFDINEIN